MAIINPTVYGSGGITATLVISVEEGAVITAVNGPTVLRAEMGDKPAKIKLTQAGDWTVTATLNGKTTTPRVVTVLEEFPVELFFEPVVRKCEETLSIAEGRNLLAGVSNGLYMLFGGGISASRGSDIVTAYDKALTCSFPEKLSAWRDSLAATSINGCALFGGGSGSTPSAVVDAYDQSLTHTIPSELSTGRYDLAAASLENYAVFAGGAVAGDTQISTADAYDQALTRIAIEPLSSNRSRLSAASVGEYVLFAGGFSTIIDAYNQFLTRLTPANMSVSRSNFAAGTVGNYAIFAGGSGKVGADVYDNALVHTTPISLSLSRNRMAGISSEHFALFGGGDTCDTGYIGDTGSSVVDAYDKALAHTVLESLREPRENLAGASVGNFLMFAGGDYVISNKSYKSGICDVYVVE